MTSQTTALEQTGRAHPANNDTPLQRSPASLCTDYTCLQLPPGLGVRAHKPRPVLLSLGGLLVERVVELSAVTADALGALARLAKDLSKLGTATKSLVSIQ